MIIEYVLIGLTFSCRIMQLAGTSRSYLRIYGLTYPTPLIPPLIAREFNCFVLNLYMI